MNVSATVTISGDDVPHKTLNMPTSQTALNAVLFDFNPSSDDRVTMIKALHAALIYMMEGVRASGDPARARCAAIAITELEGTQMRAVKALFAK